MNLHSILGGKGLRFSSLSVNLVFRLNSQLPHGFICLKKTHYLEVWGEREYGFFPKIMKHPETSLLFPIITFLHKSDLGITMH